jgi:hypothetical protein
MKSMSILAHMAGVAGPVDKAAPTPFIPRSELANFDLTPSVLLSTNHVSPCKEHLKLQ